MTAKSPRSFVEPKPVHAKDFPHLRALYERVWQRSRHEQYDRMRFLETMSGLPVGSTGWSRGELVGFFTLWPLELTDGRNIVKGGEAMDVMTDARLRGKGVFPTLAGHACQMAAEQGIKLLFGAPNEAIYATYLKRLAWASPGWIRTYVRPLSLSGAMPGGSASGPLFALWPAKSMRGAVIGHARPDRDALAQCLAKDRPARGRWRVHRTPEWYDFRYVEAGKFDYHWVTVSANGALEAFAVWGLARDRSGRLSRANIADAVGANALARQTAVAAAAAAARQAGANVLVAAMTSTQRAKEFTANGFIPFRKSPLIAKTLGPDSFDANPFSADGWDLLGGDFDYI